MIHIIDFNSTGNGHLQFNISMTKVILEAFPGNDFTFHSEEAHQNMIKSYLPDEKIRFIPIYHKDKSTSYISKVTKGFIKTIYDIFYSFKIMNKISKSRNSLLFVCAAHPLTNLFLVNIKKFFKNANVIITIHGELEYIYSSHTKREKILSIIYKKVIGATLPNLHLLLLNKISKQQLVSDSLASAAHLLEINHPYLYNFDIVRDNQIIPGKQIAIGQVGSLGKRKNGHLLYELAKMHEDLITDKKIDYWAIGPIESDVLVFQNNLVKDFTTLNNQSYIPRDVFEKKIKEIDYAVFFYGPEQFIFRASGAIPDVINFNVPIVVLKHPYFDYLFKEAGNIGFICSDIHEMASTIRSIADGDTNFIEQYQDQCTNIYNFKRNNSISAIANDIKTQISTLNIS